MTWHWGDCAGPQQVFIRPGEDLYLTLERWMSESSYAGAVLQLLHGVAAELDLMTGRPAGDLGLVATFHGPHSVRCPARLLGGHGTLGAGRDGYALHTHAIFLDARGQARGCHLVRGRCVAGTEGILVAMFPLAGARFRLRRDAETTFDLFYPEPAMPNSLFDDHRAVSRVLLVKLQPNQDLYLGLEAACREAGIDGALVLSGVGSINDAWLSRGRQADGRRTEVIEGPGLEVAGVTGRIEVRRRHDAKSRSVLTGWVTRADGSVAGGVFARRRNIVCVTFEFTLLEWAPRPEG